MFIGVSLSLSLRGAPENRDLLVVGENNSIFTPQISSFFLCLRKNRNQVVTMEYIKMCLCDKATMQEARSKCKPTFYTRSYIYIGGMCPVFRERDKCRVIERHTTARLLFFLLQKSYRRFIKNKIKKTGPSGSWAESFKKKKKRDRPDTPRVHCHPAYTREPKGFFI